MISITGHPMPSAITPGLIILHGNQLEQLRSAVFEWVRQNPLDALEQDIYLVQSNGVAEWLKIAIAEDTGVCAATKIELPGRFLWGIYRNMLGRDAIPGSSSLDVSPLTWRLMRLIPELLDQPDFAPLKRFLADGEPARRLQLAQRLAGLIDLYQLYRADWLADWTQGLDQLRNAQGDVKALGLDQCWQAQLWRAILADIPEDSRELGRVNIHQRFVAAIEAGARPVTRLPRRVVLFGISALPRQTLEALSALSKHTQVLVAVPNPCQFYWGDIIEDSQLFKAQRKRQQLKGGVDLSQFAPEDLHAHCHPLLANWGRQGRDFVRMLDDFDQAEVTRERFSSLRIDLFSEGQGTNLLERVQVAIRDLLPLTDHPELPFDITDKSIEFHVAHSVQREVEVLHDQLLAMLAEDAGNDKKALRPRDVIVMVPDIEVFSPSIRSVFGQYSRQDPRYIPFEIGDVKDRSINPILVAMDWLLRLPQQRCQQSEVRDLLDVPALAKRFGLSEEDLPQLAQWIEGAGVRWGLDQEHRGGLGLQAAGEQNSWIFGIRRMLLGYASGDSSTYSGVESYSEVGGLNAALAGSLAQFVETLIYWRAVLAESVSPAHWGERARELIQAFFVPNDESDQQILGRLDEYLQNWLASCFDAGYAESVPLAVVREAWMGAIDEQTLNHRFVSGGVTFCTLMPMRAVPFRVVCLLGLNDGDYPRRTQHVDFDLLALPGMARPGDRSRRDDDRYLMLEALLSARDKLYISWVGRNVKDNSEQPASVLVSQLRDYLAAGWDCDLKAMTTEHPLQPFSRRYFEKDGLLTYAKEWRVAHADIEAQVEAQIEVDALPAYELEPDFKLKMAELARFVKQPVKYFFRKRLGVIFTDDEASGEDDEPFGFNGLEEYHLVNSLLNDEGAPESLEQIATLLRQKAERLTREGALPIGLIGQQWQNRLVDELLPIRTEWLKLCAQYPMPAEKLPIFFEHKGIRLDDWLDRVHSNGSESVWLTQIASKVSTSKGEPRSEKLIDGWIRQLVAAALGYHVTGYLVARDAIVTMQALDQAESKQILITLLNYWRASLDQPLPTACKTALALLQEGAPYEVYNGNYQMGGEVDDLCLARLWADYDALSDEPEWDSCSHGLYGPLNEWSKTKISIQSIEELSAIGEAQ
jgi:exodeoxyribonuclease V gamma subunit